MDIIESLPGIFYVLDPDGRFLLWNSRFLQVSGYGAAEVERLHALDLFRGADRDRVARRIRDTFETGTGDVEAELVGKSGKPTPFHFTGQLVDFSGEQCLVGLGVDVSDRKRAEDFLRESEARYRSFIENTTEGVYSFELEGPVPIELPVDEQVRRIYRSRIVACNDALAQMCGYEEAGDLVGVTMQELHGGSDIPENLALLEEWVARGYHVAGAESLEIDRDGNARWFANNCLGMVEDGCLVRGWGARVDITHRKVTEQRLRLSASVFENIADGIFITDADSSIVDVNQAFVEITGFAREDVIGRDPRMLQAGRHDDSFFRELQRTLGVKGQWRGEIWYRRKDGEVFPVLLTINRVLGDDGGTTHYVFAATDISQIKQSEERLDFLAHHDPLTGLPNRALLNERLEWAMQHVRRQSRSFAVVFIDLDHFKHVNDSLGHPAGDRVLQDVGQRLVGVLRQDDTVARLGGDEFVLLLEDIAHPDKAAKVAAKVMRALAEPFEVEGRDIRVQASMGICMYPGDGDDAATLLRNADAAMFRAKDRGRNTYEFYTEELTRKAFERVLLESNLRLAVEREELFLNYQPQIELATGRVVGMEALIRWNHPELGLLSPTRFIPLAEDSGLIHAIGEWVLREACRQARAWCEAGLEFGRLGVNVSRAQLQRGRLFEDIQSALAASGLPPERLELEVTESFIMEQDTLAVEQLDRLRDCGVSIAIDDFGTGYSSLSYLKRLPVHKLKIDKSFVLDIADDDNDMAIVAAVISMGRKLGLTVLAEGVESARQADFLLENGCHEAQGFLYARPMPHEAVTAFLREQAPKGDSDSDQ
ncbi:sensor domain-containing protein [Parahaliea mediterranea]|uniref:cyclic-guanylate-specific phosphodiesterase n=1 Tax=Parahaliea mediterranea TaxID=651086 RepID=A0A939DI74_9GAMM|nr:EAL domain-containing protein [Parahaliea mediterranea]MBN7798713.1 EAL domain-containing protein [Parahaliea mediterranea]